MHIMWFDAGVLFLKGGSRCSCFGVVVVEGFETSTTMIAVNRGWFGSFASPVKVAILFLPSSSPRLFMAAACEVYVLNDVDESLAEPKTSALTR